MYDDEHLPEHTGITYTSRDELYGHKYVKRKNPGRKEDIPNILDHVKKVANVHPENDGQRKWVIAGCDGSPYILAQDFLNNLFACSVCSLEGSEDKLKDRLEKEHDGKARKERKYGFYSALAMDTLK